MITMHFYDVTTGLLSQKVLKASSPTQEFIENNTPPGHKAILGVTDPRSQRVDLVTGNLIGYQPPRPSARHQWIGKRWKLNQADRDQRSRSETARKKLIELESKQHRAVLEVLLGSDEEMAAAKQRLATIKTEKAALREIMRVTDG